MAAPNSRPTDPHLKESRRILNRSQLVLIILAFIFYWNSAHGGSCHRPAPSSSYPSTISNHGPKVEAAAANPSIDYNNVDLNDEGALLNLKQEFLDWQRRDAPSPVQSKTNLIEDVVQMSPPPSDEDSMSFFNPELLNDEKSQNVSINYNSSSVSPSSSAAIENDDDRRKEMMIVKPRAREEMKRKKKNCGISRTALRSLKESSTLKRAYFANSQQEIEEKRKAEAEEESIKLKRDANYLHHIINGDGPLPWACETKYEWEDKGADHYPRFIRTAKCQSRFCYMGLLSCRPRRHKTKVLKMLSGPEVESCEEDDDSLPESLRSTWKFVTVVVNLCCDCVRGGGGPGHQ